jgi:hypothetical protein
MTVAPYIHRSPGRLRVRCQAVKQNWDCADALQSMLEQRTGVKSVEIRPLTGSVVIRYSECIVDSEMLLSTLRDWGFVSNAEIDPAPEPPRLKRANPVQPNEWETEALLTMAMRRALEAAIERSLIKLLTSLL